MAASRGKSKRVIRHQRVRQKISGTSGRPRFSVYRSLNNIYVQVIDDELGNTIASASSLEEEIRNRVQGTGKKNVSAVVGEVAATRTKQKGVQTVVFDRGGYKFHGRVKAVADAEREKDVQAIEISKSIEQEQGKANISIIQNDIMDKKRVIKWSCIHAVR